MADPTNPAPAPVTETFATPDNLGEPRASGLQSSLGEQLGAEASDAFMGGARSLMRSSQYFGAQHGFDPLAAMGAADAGVAGMQVYDQAMADQAAQPDVPIAEARDRVKQAGLEGRVTLPDQDKIRGPVLDLMLEHAHEQVLYDAAVDRGPQGFLPDALGFLTQTAVGMVDPVNAAAFSIPVLGEARYGKILASAGDSLAARAGIKFGIGAAQGAVGGAALAPVDWWLHTQDGQDYTYADALKSVVLSAGMGGLFHGGFGTVGDLLARARGLPLHGSPEEALEHGLASARPQPALPVIPLEEVPGITASEHPLPAPAEAPDGSTAGPITSVFNDALEQLRAAGMPDEEAQANAAVVAARYETRAARLGGDKDALDLYRSEGLTIQRPDEDEDLAGRQYAQPGKPLEPGLFAEREAEGQQGLPGTERIGQGELAQRKADELLKPKKEQKPMDVGLFGDESKQRTLFQMPATAPTFYSAVERAIGTSKQDRASPEQWLATVKNTPGVKGEELQWLGLEDWLKEQKGPVTKQAIADYVRSNHVEVKEVEKGGAGIGEDALEQMALQRPDEFTQRLGDAGVNPGVAASYRRSIQLGNEAAIREVAALLHEAEPTATKFDRYRVPGGQNYREVLLTLPTRPTTDFTTFLRDYRERFPSSAADDETVRGIWQAGHTLPPPGRLASAKDQNLFHSVHWDEPNILAHIRFDDRSTSDDGTSYTPPKRTLHIAEIQSDWHQAGRKKGYRDEKLEKHRDALVEERETLARAGKLIQGHPEFPEAQRRYEEINAELERTAVGPHGWGDTGGATAGGVPDAPFKGTWHELALKRMIRYAAENGYDRLSWDTGATNAERYDLSKQISKIEWTKSGTSGFTPLDAIEHRVEGIPVHGTVNAYDHAGKLVISKIAEEGELPDIIGKEAADRLLSQSPTRTVQSGTALSVRRLEGLALKVGGEGMKGFYDKILPAAAAKLTKKFGAKVGRAEIGTGRGADERFVVRDATDQGDGEVIEAFPTRAAADRFAEDYGGGVEVREENTGNAPVHALDITPELRDAAVRQGFPLFQHGESAPQGRITLQENRAIVDLFARADRSTFMHEAGHLWLDELVRDASGENAPAGLKDDLATVLQWLGVDKASDIGVAEHEKWARGFEQYLAEGKAPSTRLAAAFDKFKEWLQAIYHGLVGFNAPISPEIRGVMDRMFATDEEIAAARSAPPHPAEVFSDLPPRVQENLVHVAMADLIAGRDVQSAEVLQEAAKEDPRLAQSLSVAPKPAAAEATPAASPEDKVVKLAPNKGPRARDPQTYSLLEFLASRGGIRDDDPLIEDLRTSTGKNKFVPGFGSLIRKPKEISTAARLGGKHAPMTLDQAREAAVEAGYIHDAGDVTGGTARSTIDTLLQAVDRESRGEKVYREGHRAPENAVDAEEERHHMEGALDQALEEAGINPADATGKTRERTLEIMAREGFHADPVGAFERAAMEEVQSGAEAGHFEPRAEKIPGWDETEDAGSAPGGGGAAAQEPVAGGAGRGEEPRAGGPADGSPRQAAGGVADFKKFASDGRPVADPGLAAESKIAEKTPEPVSIDVAKVPTAAEAAAADADKLLADLLPKLSQEERATFEDKLTALEQDKAAREQMIREGAACLAEAAA